MALLVVQVGQCGNQLGDELFTELSITTRSRTISSPFFARDGMARCVLVDSEPKVVQGVFARHSDSIRRENVVSGQSGRGNNWALGYHGLARTASQESRLQPFHNLGKDQRSEDASLLTRALRAIHIETRRTADSASFEAILLLHSLAGGTGSGLASRLAEKIRLYFVDPPAGTDVDERHEAKAMRADGLDGMLVEKRRARYFLSITVAPQRGGELSTQGLNAALTLQTLCRQLNAVIILRNDDALAPGDATGNAVDAGAGRASLVQRCQTFREANEVLITLLLPLFNYGVGGDGCVSALLRQLLPRRRPGDNRPVGCLFLTLLPTPQRTYSRLRRTVRRCRFFALYGAKDYLPGCKAELPVSDLLTRTALAEWRSAEDEREAQGGSRGSRHTLMRRTRDGGGARRTGDYTAVGRRESSYLAAEDVVEDGDGDGAETAVCTEVAVAAPRELVAHFNSIARNPAAALYRTLEGVAVLDAARELNATVLFPLLRAAALKVKVGAFLTPFERAGVKSAQIEAAYRNVAEYFSAAEEED